MKLLQRIKCLLRLHDVTCAQTVVLLPKSGFILHGHYCNFCEWFLDKPKIPLTDAEFKMLDQQVEPNRPKAWLN